MKQKKTVSKTHWFTQVMFQDKDCNRIDFTLSEGAFSSKYQSVEPNDRSGQFYREENIFLEGIHGRSLISPEHSNPRVESMNE